MTKPSTDYTRFDPEKLFPSAMEEILFGRGTFEMALDTEEQAHIVARRWTEFLLKHPIGTAFSNIRRFNKVMILQSDIGEEAVQYTTYANSNLSFIGMNSVVKADFLSQFEAKVKELS